MRSTVVTRASALLLALAGVSLLFAPIEILARVAPEVPVSTAWIAQLLAAAWLGLAAMNWTTRFAIVGGIYGRAVGFANATTYFVSAMTLLRFVRSGAMSMTVLAITAVAVVMAAIYGWLLLRGPFAADRTPVAQG